MPRSVPPFAQRAIALSTVLLLGVLGCGESPSSPRVGPPARLRVLAGDAQEAPAGTLLPQVIRLRVEDQSGRGVPGATVGSEVVEGDGALLGQLAVISDASGDLTVPQWRLGRRATPQRVKLTSGAASAEVTATVATSFDITFRFVGERPVSLEHRQVFERAAARVRGLVTGDLLPVDATGSGFELGDCGVQGGGRLDEVIDDVLILAAVGPIDGPRGVLAQAGPCLIRSGGSRLTAVGVMSFDAEDLGTFLQGAVFEEVITHEIIHVLGFGTLWQERGLVLAADTEDPRYAGLQGHHGCAASSWAALCGSMIALEAGGGSGTALGHWRESTFGDELLTGYYGARGSVLSTMTVGAMRDLGFVVNMAAADVALPLLSSRDSAPSAEGHWERGHRAVGEITADGQVRRSPRPAGAPPP